MWLKQSTVAVISFGPIVDKTDAVTLEVAAGIITSLDAAATGIMLSKNGGTLAVREQGANFVATTYDAHGCYKVSLSVIDTGTLGRLRVIHTEPATYLAVWHDFMVVTADAYALLTNAAIEGTQTFWGMFKIMAASLAGKSSGGGTATIIFRDVADVKPRITATADANGNRSAMTLDGT